MSHSGVALWGFTAEMSGNTAAVTHEPYEPLQYLRGHVLDLQAQLPGGGHHQSKGALGARDLGNLEPGEGQEGSGGVRKGQVYNQSKHPE